jgi:hypothetical protein
MRKSPSNKAYLGIADTGPDNTRYIWVSGNNGRKARLYWLFGVRRAGIASVVLGEVSAEVSGAYFSSQESISQGSCLAASTHSFIAGWASTAVQ